MGTEDKMKRRLSFIEDLVREKIAEEKGVSLRDVAADAVTDAEYSVAEREYWDWMNLG